ncbi:MAG: cyclopropane fatty acyl phospholipid synthase, partial [Candidatus Staskawiczbacteria bacterium]|nr:cyclopropane fatty acyl phospholipid synthase [Candidatus Staskawiczbacteria bacterium]
RWVEKIIEPSGIKINGSNPWDVRVVNSNFYDRLRTQGSLGLGESYMDAWWECDRLDEFFYRLLSSDIPSRVGLSLPLVLGAIKAKLFNLQAIKRAFQIGEKHYDIIGNDIFEPMLGRTMAYTCGYWRDADSLDQAQDTKMDLICRKLGLQKGQRVLDIGCGWGGFAFFAVKKYEARVVGITVSKEQIKFAEQLCGGLPAEFRFQDYRELNEKFDHIVSVGMFEHVGAKNYRTFFEMVKRCLKEDGLALLHTIGRLNTSGFADPWINKYIFPNGMLPSLKQITSATEGLFVIEDVHSFGSDYDKTLLAWHKNFESSWPKLESKYGERFHRMWNYYLLSCAGAFRARTNQLWQIVFSPSGVAGGYKPAR